MRNDKLYELIEQIMIPYRTEFGLVDWSDKMCVIPTDSGDELQDETSRVLTPILLVELSLVMVSLFGLTFLVGGVGFLVPILYILLDSARRGRKREDLGFKSIRFSSDLKSNAKLMALGVVVIQGLIISVGLLTFPWYLDYVIAHRAWSVSLGVEAFAFMLSSIPFTTLLEEVVFRGLTQERLSWFLENHTAVIVATGFFVLIHWAPSDPAILLIDMTAIAAGGIIYGIIYGRCRNIYVTWLTHMLSDIHGIVLLFLIFNFL